MKRSILFLIQVITVLAIYSQGTIEVATWNLEHFHDGATRGFPEYLSRYNPPGPKIPERTVDDYKFIARVISDKDFSIVALQEIYGEKNAAGSFYSKEIDKLTSYLGDNWKYVIGVTGYKQHLVIIYDSDRVILKGSYEMELEDEEVQKKDLFDRQPLVGWFEIVSDSQPKTDFYVVNVHLASGQYNNLNHDMAMNRIFAELRSGSTTSNQLGGFDEDIIILGDYNANRFDNKVESFWDEREELGWDVLGDSKDDYSPTRLSGSPLRFNNSRIDYILISKGMDNDEISQDLATIHVDLVGNPSEFRKKASDHIPVSVAVRFY